MILFIYRKCFYLEVLGGDYMIDNRKFLAYLKCKRRAFLLDCSKKDDYDDLIKNLYMKANKGIDCMYDFDTTIKHLNSNQILYNGCIKKDDLICYFDMADNNGFYIFKNGLKLSVRYQMELEYISYCMNNDKKYYVYLINPNYVLQDELDINQLVIKKEVEIKRTEYVKEVIRKINKLSYLPTNIEYCYNECEFRDYCFKDISSDSILNLSNSNKKYNYYNNGIKTFTDMLNSKLFDDLSLMNKRQILYSCKNLDTYIDKILLEDFLSKIKYPIYFLDFESISEEIPPFKGAKPYQTIPFLYSLHIYDGNKLSHHYFFMEKGIDDRYNMALSLDTLIGDLGSIIAYNTGIEKEIIGSLSNYVPRLKTFLNRFKDLEIPFRNNYVYDKEFFGSHSIKYVYPALIKNDIFYKDLDCQNGLSAMEIYQNMTSDDDKEDLIKYCSLDTYACYKIYLKLCEFLKK